MAGIILNLSSEQVLDNKDTPEHIQNRLFSYEVSEQEREWNMGAVERMIDDIKNQLSSGVGEKLVIVRGHNLKVHLLCSDVSASFMHRADLDILCRELKTCRHYERMPSISPD